MVNISLKNKKAFSSFLVFELLYLLFSLNQRRKYTTWQKNQWTNSIGKSLKVQKDNIIDTKRERKRLEIEKEENADKQKIFKLKKKLNKARSKV